MNRLIFIPIFSIAVLVGVSCSESGPTSPAAEESSAFHLRLSDLLSNPSSGVTVSGDPQMVTDERMGEVVLFDGVDDAIFIDKNPIEGLTRFTVEIIFRQDGGGSQEPRFFHIGHAKGDRMLLETRLAEDDTWHLDSFLRSGENYKVLIDPEQKHPIGEWAHVALVLEDGHMRHFVNGKQELEGNLEFKPMEGGGISLGVRMNKIHWFKGAIHSIRVTPEALGPDSFLSVRENVDTK
jgi:hypothetical protein